MPTKLQGRGPLRPRIRGDAIYEHSEALLRADEIFVRMVVWATAGIICGIFAFLFSLWFVFPALLFGGAWVAAADNRRVQLKCAENWQKYLDDMENERQDIIQATEYQLNRREDFSA